MGGISLATPAQLHYNEVPNKEKKWPLATIL
jgi:hypothetical protein